MSLEYLLLPRLQVQAANAQAAWWLINAAPVMAATMFAHNLGRHTGILPVGVGIVHHDAQLLGEKGKMFYGRFRPQQRRGAVYIDGDDYSSKNKHALSLQPTASCHLTWSLLLAFDDSEGLPGTAKVADFLAGARLAGGQIVDHAKPLPLSTGEEVRRAIRSGFWLIERQDLMETDDGDPLDALIRATTLRHPPKIPDSLNIEGTASSSLSLWRAGVRGSNRDGNLPETELSPGGESLVPAYRESWIVPTTLGYAPITEFADRTGAREGYPHAYAEPLVGLVQYVSVNRYAESPPPLWRHAWLPNDVFVVTQQEV
jgi:CRISPR-associated protein Csy2